MNVSFSLFLSSIIFIIMFSLAYSTTTTHSSHLILKQAAQNGAASADDSLWCVAKNNAEDAALQSSLDWACGAGGADCGPIQQGGPCYDPTDIQKTASYAFNDYFLKHGLAEEHSCDFSNTAALTSLNPSYGNCKFPSSSAGNNGNFNGSSIMGTRPGIAETSGGSCLICIRSWAIIYLILLFGLVF